MSQKESVSYKLYPEYLLATGYFNDEESKIRYVEYENVRDAVISLMDVLLSGCGREIFSGICGCCGLCCLDRAALLDAREIVAVSGHLGISEALFREKYVMPAATWNRQDGALGLEGGKCVFLKEGSSGTCKCAIYEVRPASCREMEPSPERCRKDPGKLLTYVERLDIEPRGLTCHLTGGSSYNIEQMTPQLQDALKKFYEVVYPCLGTEQNELDQIAGDAHRVLDWLIDNYRAGVSLEILMPRFLGIKGVVDDIDILTSLRKKDPEDLELLWLKVRYLADQFSSGKGSEAALEKKNEAEPVIICLKPTSLSIEIKSRTRSPAITLHYEQGSRLLGLVRDFMEALVASGEPGLIDVLGHSSPYCFMCGVCCGFYDLEITALDVERIADHLGISEKELWEKYLEPGVRSWNRKDAMIRRLRKAGCEGECVFLRAKSSTESVCGIYEARAQVCRDYSPDHRLCQKQSLLLRGYEHMGYIISCHVADDIARLTTHHTLSQNKEPFAIPLKNDGRLREAFRQVKEEALLLLGKG